MDAKTYHAPIECKADGPAGSFVATFATLNTIDLDGDVTRPGAFQNGQRVKIAAWGHNWGSLTVGRGTIYADETRAWVEGQFNLNTQAGREHYETVKFNGEDQEFSYGFEITKASYGEFAGREVRFLEGLNVHEVSPVLLGAGIGTRLDAIKATELPPADEPNADQPPAVATTDTKGYGLSEEDHSERVRVAVQEYVQRLTSGSEMRRKEGRAISSARRTRMETVMASLLNGADEIKALLEETAPPEKSRDATALFLDFQHTLAALNGAVPLRS